MSLSETLDMRGLESVLRMSFIVLVPAHSICVYTHPGGFPVTNEEPSPDVCIVLYVGQDYGLFVAKERCVV